MHAMNKRMFENDIFSFEMHVHVRVWEEWYNKCIGHENALYLMLYYWISVIPINHFILNGKPIYQLTAMKRTFFFKRFLLPQIQRSLCGSWFALGLGKICSHFVLNYLAYVAVVSPDTSNPGYTSLHFPVYTLLCFLYRTLSFVALMSSDGLFCDIGQMDISAIYSDLEKDYH